jgi:uncharacterized membrane protein
MKLSLKSLKIMMFISAVLTAFFAGIAISSMVCQCGDKKLFSFLIFVFAGISFLLSYIAERKKTKLTFYYILGKQAT